MGTGQRVLGMDRRGNKLPLYNKASYGYTTKAEQMYYSLPAVLSSNKYLLLFDNVANGEVDLGKTDKDVLRFSAVDGRTAYVVVTGDDTPEIILKTTPPSPAGSHCRRVGHSATSPHASATATTRSAGYHREIQNSRISGRCADSRSVLVRPRYQRPHGQPGLV